VAGLPRYVPEMADLSFTNVMVVGAIAVAAPLIAVAIPKVKVPGIVIEFALGVVVGPDVLGWVSIDEPLDVLSLLALGFLLFIAGTEVELKSLRGTLLTKAVAGYAISFALAMAIALTLGAADIVLTPALIAVILSATGLGVVIPILRAANLTTTATGQTILIVATVAEFTAVLLLALFFGEGQSGVLANLLVVVLYAVIAVVLWLLLRWVDSRPRVMRQFEKMEGGTVQIRIRIALLILFLFLVVSQRFGLESILGAFAAGIVLGDLRRADRDDPASSFWPKVEALGFGFLIPLYFVVGGIRFDLSGLLDSPSAMLRVPLFLVLFLVVRGVPALLFRKQLGARTTAALALLSATSLSFVITATDIGVRIGKLRDINATALVGAAVLAMVIFPLVAQSLLSGSRAAPEGGVEPGAHSGEAP
jgi:Kef-type K+ transport system membrane component KefB